jgi:ribosomal protein S18 acetylase RimI-like enzyme
MILSPNFKPSPWDSAVFGVDAYEIAVLNREALETAVHVLGHYTVRMEPQASKQLLHEYGFYYCDTLIEPYCTAERFACFDDASAGMSRFVPLDPLIVICHGAFSHGRFHRDFNLSQGSADQRYDIWLKQLHGNGKVYGLLYLDEPVGFIAVDGNRLVLHAISESLRGRGLAKYLWTPVCRTLFEKGCDEVVSSVSATNLAVVNLYATLGFRFRNPVDIYHRLVS